MRAWIFGCGLVAAGLSAAAAAQGAPGWRHLRTIGMIDMVVVDKAREKEKDIYRLAFSQVCGRKPDFCKVMFWADERLVPTRMPMTDAQADALRANFTINSRTGTRSILWNCVVDRDGGNCFR